MNLKKLISLILACLMLSLAFTGCGLLDLDKLFSKETETEEPEAPTSVFIAADAVVEYAIVRGDSADTETAAAVTKLFSELMKKFGTDIVFKTDYAKTDADIPTDTKEILVGATNRAESKGIRYLDYEIRYENDRIIVNGGSYAAVAEAVDYFIANCIKDNGLEVPVSYTVSNNYPQGGLTVNGEFLQKFSVKEIEGELDDTLRVYLGEQVGIYSESPTGNEIILKTDSKYGITELDIYMENGDLIIANSSERGDCSFALEYFMEQIKNVKNDEVTLVGNVSMTVEGYKTATDADIAELRAETDARIE